MSSVPSNDDTQPPTSETLRADALAAYASRRAAEQARRMADAQAELPRRAAEYLAGLLVTPDMFDGEEFIAGDLRFRLSATGGLLVLLPCVDGVGLCEHAFVDLAGLGALLSISD